MNVSLKNNDAVSGVLKLEVTKPDYADLLAKSLQKLRQQVNMPGFRKGMVPMSVVKKLYGKQAMAEEINKLVSDRLYGYLKENDIKILGEPLPNETEQKQIDFEVDEDFDFYFDLAFAPVIDVELNKSDELTWYQIKIDDAMIDEQVASYRKSFGSYDKVDKVEAEDMVKGVLVELADGAPKADGISLEEAVLMPSYIKGKMEQKKFIGAKIDHTVVFNPYKAYKGAEAELASFLNIDREKVKEMKSDFTFEIKEITRFQPAELNQEFFDKVFGVDIVKDEASFREKIKASIEIHNTPESEYKFALDVRELLIKKADGVVFADDLLKRWLLLTGENTTKEQVDEDYPKLVADLKYHLIREKLLKDNDISVQQEDIDNFGKRIVREQFAQYGMMSVPDDILEKYVDDLFKKQETKKNIIDRVIEEKISILAKDKTTFTIKEVSSEQFSRLLKVEEEQPIE